MYQPKTVTIIGFGRFGQTLYKLIGNDFSVKIFNRSPLAEEEKLLLKSNAYSISSLENAYESDVIFYCVPISTFENVIKNHKKYFGPHHILIDVLSVKLYPKSVLEKYLKNIQTQALLTHPMFGPDSSKNGFENLPLILDKFKTHQVVYKFWKNYFLNKKLRILELSAEEHDRMAAQSQGVTHFIGRLLEAIHLQQTSIDSLGTKKLLEIKEQTCNDTWQLFNDLQTYNPYTKRTRLKIGNAYDNLYNKLLPKRVNKKYLVFGIQGGIGSFNEEAILNYLNQKKINKFKIKYLYTTKRVLNSLHNGEIDFGQFAISNAKGGLVDESIKAIPGYKFKIVSEFDIVIRHSLMKLKDIKFKEIKTITAHPQVFAQCQENLVKKYPYLEQKSGTRDFVDTAKVARSLALGKLPDNTAILGPKILAKHYDFEIIEDNLQDLQNNLTKFLIVKR